jgi:hypothetical protein
VIAEALAVPMHLEHQQQQQQLTIETSLLDPLQALHHMMHTLYSAYSSLLVVEYENNHATMRKKMMDPLDVGRTRAGSDCE